MLDALIFSHFVYLYTVWHSVARTCRRRPGLNRKQHYPRCPFVCLINMLISSPRAEIKSPENTPELRVNPHSSPLRFTHFHQLFSLPISTDTDTKYRSRCPRKANLWGQDYCPTRARILEASQCVLVCMYAGNNRVCVCRRAVIDRCSNLSVVLHPMVTDRLVLESLPQRSAVSARKKWRVGKCLVSAANLALV